MFDTLVPVPTLYLHILKAVPSIMHYLHILVALVPFTLTAAQDVNIHWENTTVDCHSAKVWDCCKSLPQEVFKDNAVFTNLPVHGYVVKVYGYRQGGCQAEEIPVTSTALEPTFTMSGMAAVSWSTSEAYPRFPEEQQQQQMLRTQKV
ncbi:MAG: hypothetical protein Q9172_002994 [Xanthocarpia lactea]